MTADERFDRIDRSFEALTQSLNTLTRYVLDFREETVNRLQTIENRLELFASSFAGLDSRLPALTKGIMDLGAGATQFEREQWKQREAAADLASRVAKLEQIVSKLVPAA
jgi:hypothetical protein